MKINRINSLENKLNMQRDIAFRELGHQINNDLMLKERTRVSLEDIYSESGPLDLTEYEFPE